MLRREFLKLIIGTAALAGAGVGLFKLWEQFGEGVKKEIELPVEEFIELPELRRSSGVSVEDYLEWERKREANR